MSAQSALDFIHHLRNGESAAVNRSESSNFNSIAQLLSEAQANGYDFSERELREAFATDWAMRCQLEGVGG